MKRIITLCIIISAAELFCISLRDIPGIIASNSLPLKKQRLELQSREIEIGNQLLRFTPNLVASGGMYHDTNYNWAVSGGVSSTLTVSQDIFFDQAVERLTYENFKTAYLQFYQSELYDTYALYVTALKDRISLEIALSNEQLSKKQYEFVASKKQSGNASELDLINALAEYDNDIYTSELSRINAQSSLSKLAQKLELNTITILEDVPAGMPLTPITASNTLIPAQRVFAAVSIASNSLSIEETRRLQTALRRFAPFISVTGTADLVRHTYTTAAEAWVRNNSLDLSLGVSFNLPIWGRNEVLGKLQQTDLAIQRAKTDIELAAKNTKKELEESVLFHNNKTALLNVSRQRLKSAELNTKMMAESYRLGVSSLIDFYQSEKSYREAKRDLAFLTYDVLLLKLNIGKLLDDTMRFLPK
ncbi:MAG: TolC family protein [Spirochaetes bacterium]|nr:TolC family protein [Spirochaetota bacterium]